MSRLSAFYSTDTAFLEGRALPEFTSTTSHEGMDEDELLFHLQTAGYLYAQEDSQFFTGPGQSHWKSFLINVFQSRRTLPDDAHRLALVWYRNDLLEALFGRWRQLERQTFIDAMKLAVEAGAKSPNFQNMFEQAPVPAWLIALLFQNALATASQHDIFPKWWDRLLLSSHVPVTVRFWLYFQLKNSPSGFRRRRAVQYLYEFGKVKPEYRQEVEVLFPELERLPADLFLELLSELITYDDIIKPWMKTCQSQVPELDAGWLQANLKPVRRNQTT